MEAKISRNSPLTGMHISPTAHPGGQTASGCATEAFVSSRSRWPTSPQAMTVTNPGLNVLPEVRVLGLVAAELRAKDHNHSPSHARIRQTERPPDMPRLVCRTPGVYHRHSQTASTFSAVSSAGVWIRQDKRGQPRQGWAAIAAIANWFTAGAALEKHHLGFDGVTRNFEGIVKTPPKGT